MLSSNNQNCITDVRREPYLTNSDALAHALWYFHSAPLMQAFIIDGDYNICHSIEQIAKTIGRAVLEVYSVQTISPLTKSPLLSSSGPTNFQCARSYPTFPEALEDAKNLIGQGFNVALSKPDGTRLLNEEISKASD